MVINSNLMSNRIVTQMLVPRNACFSCADEYLCHYQSSQVTYVRMLDLFGRELAHEKILGILLYN